MSGCFGNHPIDQWMERQLDQYLDSIDDEEEDEDEKDFDPTDAEIERAENRLAGRHRNI